jgi:hypothetical protein
MIGAGEREGGKGRECWDFQGINAKDAKSAKGGEPEGTQSNRGSREKRRGEPML